MRTATLLGVTVAVLAAASLSSCSSSTPSSPQEPAQAASSATQSFGSESIFNDAATLADAMERAGVSCESPETLPASGGASSMFHCDGKYGTLTFAVFPGSTVPASWAEPLRLLCGNPIGDEYIKGGNWTILPTGALGNANTDALAKALKASAVSACA